MCALVPEVLLIMEANPVRTWKTSPGFSACLPVTRGMLRADTELSAAIYSDSYMGLSVPSLGSYHFLEWKRS